MGTWGLGDGEGRVPLLYAPSGSRVRGEKGPQDIFHSLHGSRSRGKQQMGSFGERKGPHSSDPTPVSLMLLSLRLFPRPSQTPHSVLDTHSIPGWGRSPHPPTATPCRPTHSPSLRTWATTPPSYQSPLPQPDLLLLPLGPRPSAAGNKQPSSPCHLFDDSHTPILPVCLQPTPCWAPSGHMHSYTLRVMHLPDLPWQRHTLFRTDVPPPNLLPTVRTRTRAHTASLPSEAPLPAWPAPPTSPDGPPSLPSQAGGSHLGPLNTAIHKHT